MSDIIYNSWTRTHSHAVSGAISCPWHCHWCTYINTPNLWLSRSALVGGMWQCACVRLRRDWLWLYRAVSTRFHKFIFINNNIVIAWSVKKEDDKITKTVIQTQISDITRYPNLDAASQCVPTTLLDTTTRMIRDVMHNWSNWEYHLRVPKSGTLAWVAGAVLLRKALFCIVWFFFQ